MFHEIGEMPEWSNGTVSKTVVALKSDPGFESLSLRQQQVARHAYLQKCFIQSKKHGFSCFLLFLTPPIFLM